MCADLENIWGVREEMRYTLVPSEVIQLITAVSRENLKRKITQQGRKHENALLYAQE